MFDKEINDRLIRLYGKEQFTELPKYRVVWSDIQTEKRLGSYDVLTQETGIWLGTKTGLVEIKKYWYFKTSCWVLERCEPNINRKDVLYDKYTYEPLFTFVDKDDNRLPLNWRVIELIASRLEKASKNFLTESDHAKIEEKRLKVEEEKVYGILDNPDSLKPLPTFKTSTLVPKSKQGNTNFSNLLNSRLK